MRKIIVSSLIGGSCILILANWFWMKYTLQQEREIYSYKQMKSVESCERLIRETVSTCTSINQPNTFFFSLPNFDMDLFQLSVQNNKIGETFSWKKFLTIGIPSVKRRKGHYLIQTLKSIIKETTPEEKENVTLVILLADADAIVRKQRLETLVSIFKEYIDSGFIHIIQTVPSMYPSFGNLHKTFNDSMGRVLWRAKQVIDFAYLFNYSLLLSDYFLILEDDILCAPHFVTVIHDFIKAQSDDWVSLTFAGFLIIGRVLKSSDLQRLVSFLMLFYSEKPVDLLILQFVDLLVPSQTTITRRIPSLFQHVGLHSSLDGKVQKIKDRNFLGTSKRFSTNNPPADVITTMEMYENFYPELAYNSVFGFFWGHSPKVNDTFDIVFHKQILIERIYIETGSKEHPDDILYRGLVEVGLHFIEMESNNRISCSNFTTVGMFEKGKIDVNPMIHHSLSLSIVQCIRIRILQNQENWLIISEIAIFT